MNNSNNNKIDFIGIGAPKSGSSWISKCLEQHPDILFSSQKTRKELFFFNTPEGWVWDNNKVGRMSYYDRGINWYLEQFPNSQPGKIRGEFTTGYLSDGLAYKRIKESFPNVKILVALRNPIEMIYSLHWYIYHGAVIKIDKDFNKNLEKGIFTDKGFYYKHLKKFYDNFPSENIKVILYDEIKNQPENTVKELYKFLDVDAAFLPSSFNQLVNKTLVPRSALLKDTVSFSLKLLDNLGFEKIRLKIFESQKLQDLYTRINKTQATYPPLTDHLRKKGIDIYREDILNLQKLIDKDLSTWLIY